MRSLKSPLHSNRLLLRTAPDYSPLRQVTGQYLNDHFILALNFWALLPIGPERRRSPLAEGTECVWHTWNLKVRMALTGERA